MQLRAYIDSLEKSGAVKRILRPVTWKYEIGALARKSRCPLLFENIRDYPGSRLFTGGQSSASLIGQTIGLAPPVSRKRCVQEIGRRLSNRICPVMVENGPVNKNHRLGAQLDILEMPVPWWSEIDGGRYAGTWHVNITKNPLSGVRNLGVYRMQVLGRDRLSVSVSPQSHLARHAKIAEAKNQPLEMAVAIGVAESMVLVGGASFPFDTDEYEYAGALEEKPVELVSCASVSLEVPAECEYVLEGTIEPGIRVQDGPYLDYAGIPSTNPRAYLFVVKRMMFRDNPIFRGTSVGVPGAEDHQMFAILSRLGLVDFHGSGVRQKLQNSLLKRRYFRLFQMTGRFGMLRSKVRRFAS